VVDENKDDIGTGKRRRRKSVRRTQTGSLRHLSIVKLKQQLNRGIRELDVALNQQEATAKALRVISSKFAKQVSIANETSRLLNELLTLYLDGNSSQDLMLATMQMQEMQMSFNLQYLMLQENIQNDSRQYTCLSDVMKARNDTTRGILSNLK